MSFFVRPARLIIGKPDVRPSGILSRARIGPAIVTLFLLFLSLPSAAAWQYAGPRDLLTLTRDSDAVILGKVVKLIANYTGIDSAGSIYYAGTVFQVNLGSRVKGLTPETLYVADFPSGDSMVTIGQDYVLFLTNSWKCAPSPPSPPCVLPPTPLKTTYHIVGGPQGKFLVVEGRVYGYKSLFPDKDSWLSVDANGIPLGDFLSQVRDVYFMNELLPFVLLYVGVISAGVSLVIFSLISNRPWRWRVEHSA